MEEIRVYQADCSGVHQDKAEEMGFRVEYLAETDDHAIESAARFLRNRCNAFGLIPGCIKVGKFCINEIGPKGEYRTVSAFPFFEWKYDTSAFPFEDILYSAFARKAQQR